jgi:serine/threonine kinase 19
MNQADQKKVKREIILDGKASERFAKRQTLLLGSKRPEPIRQDLNNEEGDGHQPRQIRQEEEELSFRDFPNSIVNDTMTDTFSVILYLKDRLDSRFPPLVFLHQIYALLKHRTQVDREIELLKRERRILKFRLAHSLNSIAVMFSEDYEKYLIEIQDQHEIFRNFHDYLKSRDVETMLDTTSMLQSMQAKDEELTLLMNEGFLAIRDEISFWLGVPNVGILLSQLMKAKDELIKYLRRRPFFEILERDIISKKFKHIFMDIRYVLLYMEGIGLLEARSSPSGTLYRLRPS